MSERRTRQTDQFNVRAGDGKVFNVIETSTEEDVSTPNSQGPDWQVVAVVWRLRDGTSVSPGEGGAVTIHLLVPVTASRVD